MKFNKKTDQQLDTLDQRIQHIEKMEAEERSGEALKKKKMGSVKFNTQEEDKKGGIAPNSPGKRDSSMGSKMSSKNNTPGARTSTLSKVTSQHEPKRSSMVVKRMSQTMQNHHGLDDIQVAMPLNLEDL